MSLPIYLWRDWEFIWTSLFQTLNRSFASKKILLALNWLRTNSAQLTLARAIKSPPNMSLQLTEFKSIDHQTRTYTFYFHGLPWLVHICKLSVNITSTSGAGCTKVLAVTLANGDRIHCDGFSKINLFLPIYWAMESAWCRKLKKWYD